MSTELPELPEHDRYLAAQAAFYGAALVAAAMERALLNGGQARDLWRILAVTMSRQTWPDLVGAEEQSRAQAEAILSRRALDAAAAAENPSPRPPTQRDTESGYGYYL